MAKEISGRGRRRSRETGNQGVGDFRFITFTIFFFFFSIILLYHFFLYFFSAHNIHPHPHPHPRPTTSTHYPRPTTFSDTRVKQSQYSQRTVIIDLMKNQLEQMVISFHRGLPYKSDAGARRLQIPRFGLT